MSRMLLSIKPQYVQRIIDGTKKYEFRKFRCRHDVDTIVIYCTAPVKKVVGEVALSSVMVGGVDQVWDATKHAAGMQEAEYRDYYRGRDIAFAYELGQVTVYDQPKLLSDLGIAYIPQSFAYLGALV